MIRELFGRYLQLTSADCQVVLPHDGPEFPGVPRAREIRIPWDHRQSLRRIFFQTVQMGWKYGQGAVLLITDSKTPLFLPRDCMVVPLVTDLAVYRMSEVYRFTRVLWWRLQYRYLKRHVRLWLAISEFTKREMIEILNIPAERIHIVPCACAQEFARVEEDTWLEKFRLSYSLPKPFVLFVGNNNPRKNLSRVIRAFDKAKERGGLSHELIIAGEQGWKFDPASALQGLKHPDSVRFIGFVPDEDMPALYSVAELFAFPTLYEGFGIPVLEAQACGTPVLTSRCSSLPEVGGEGALYVDPYDEEEMTDGILRLLLDRDLVKELVQKGFSNVQRFSWEESARRLDQIIVNEGKT